MAKNHDALVDKGQYVSIEDLRAARTFVLKLLIALKRKSERNNHSLGKRWRSVLACCLWVRAFAWEMLTLLWHTDNDDRLAFQRNLLLALVLGEINLHLLLNE
jgi:hypothetical protein